jgi:hypothetical protein
MWQDDMSIKFFWLVYVAADHRVDVKVSLLAAKEERMNSGP